MGKVNCQGSMEHIALLADEGLNQGLPGRANIRTQP